MQPKYQIFVSSTYDDLKEEREAVIKAILEMGHIPVGMEMFSADDDEQWEIIKRHIDETDYYIVVVAHRYGSLTKEKISYTEKEYDYAISIGVPVLGFVIQPNALINPENIEQDLVKKEKLESFRVKVKQKPVDFWENRDGLKIKVAVALGKKFNVHKRPGWVRSTEAASPETLEEMSRLSSENAELRSKLKDYDQSLEFNGVSFEKLIQYLSKQIPPSINYGELQDKLTRVWSVINIETPCSIVHFFYLYRNQFLSGLKVRRELYGFSTGILAVLNLLLKYDLISKFDTVEEERELIGTQSYNCKYANYRITELGRKFLVKLEEAYDCNSIEDATPINVENWKDQ